MVAVKVICRGNASHKEVHKEENVEPIDFAEQGKHKATTKEDRLFKEKLFIEKCKKIKARLDAENRPAVICRYIIIFIAIILFPAIIIAIKCFS